MASAATVAVAACIAGSVVGTLVAGLVLLAAALTISGRRRRPAITDPAVLVAGFTAFFTTGRTAYVLDREAFGSLRDAPIPLRGNEEFFARGILAQLLAATLFVVAARLVLRREGRHGGASHVAPHRATLNAAVVVAAIVGVVALAWLIRDAGGMHPFVDAIGVRQQFFDDRGWLVIFPLLFPAAVLAWFAFNAGGLRTGNRRMLAAVLLIAAACVAAATGSRSTVVLLVLLPALVILELRRRPLPLWAGALCLLLVFVGASAYREAVRDRGLAIERPEAVDGRFAFAANTFAGADAELPDPPAVLEMRDVELKWGATIVSAVAAPVPRRLWPGKPESASAEYTQLIVPRLFAVNRAEYAVTFAGEMMWNLSWPGLLAFALLGGVVAQAHRRALDRRDPLAVLLFAAALAATLRLLRGDLFNTLIVTTEIFAPALFIAWLAARRGRAR